mgnify:CR=1 FL=1
MELLEFSTRVGIATLAGLFIGAEREFRKKSAGLKTNSLVSLGACVFVLLSLTFRGEKCRYHPCTWTNCKWDRFYWCWYDLALQTKY